MVHRIPLIVNSTASQIQELPTSDSLAGGLPLGAIIMWSGNASGTGVPTGFTLCDGNSGTAVNGITIPNLVDKFIVGANAVTGSDGTYPGVSMNQTGGNADATLVTHTHKYAFASEDSGDIGNDYNSSGITNVTNHGDINELSQGGQDDGADLAGYTADTQSQGSAATNANIPPFYALAYIIRTS